MHLAINMKTGQHSATRFVHPECALLQSERATQAAHGKIQCTHCQRNAQLRSAPDNTQFHGASGARNRFLAACDSAAMSSRVRKSMVPNSRSHAGGAQMRAPIAK